MISIDDDEDSDESSNTGNKKEVRWRREDDKALIETVRNIEQETGKTFDIVSPHFLWTLLKLFCLEPHWETTVQKHWTLRDLLKDWVEGHA